MKGLLKNLGLIMVVLGAVILIAIFLTGSSAVNDNGVLGGSIFLIIAGIIVYIIMNKRITDWPLSKGIRIGPKSKDLGPILI